MIEIHRLALLSMRFIVFLILPPQQSSTLGCDLQSPELTAAPASVAICRYSRSGPLQQGGMGEHVTGYSVVVVVVVVVVGGGGEEGGWDTQKVDH